MRYFIVGWRAWSEWYELYKLFPYKKIPVHLRGQSSCSKKTGCDGRWELIFMDKPLQEDWIPPNRTHFRVTISVFQKSTFAKIFKILVAQNVENFGKSWFLKNWDPKSKMCPVGGRAFSWTRSSMNMSSQLPPHPVFFEQQISSRSNWKMTWRESCVQTEILRYA